MKLIKDLFKKKSAEEKLEEFLHPFLERADAVNPENYVQKMNEFDQLTQRRPEDHETLSPEGFIRWVQSDPGRNLTITPGSYTVLDCKSYILISSYDRVYGTDHRPFVDRTYNLQKVEGHCGEVDEYVKIDPTKRSFLLFMMGDGQEAEDWELLEF